MKPGEVKAAMICGIALGLGLGAALLRGADPVAPGEAEGGLALQATNLPLRQVSAAVFEIGGVRLNKKLKTAQFDTQVNMNQGAIEYLLVSTAGKLHESLLRTTIEPEHLHVAMLLLGAQGAAPEAADVTGAETPVRILANWQTDAGEQARPVEDWVLNKTTGAPMERGPWTYLGSKIIHGTFMAQRERSLVAIMTDPFALIGNPKPGHENDKIWSPRTAEVPPVGTPVRITIQLEMRQEKQGSP